MTRMKKYALAVSVTAALVAVPAALPTAAFATASPEPVPAPGATVAAAPAQPATAKAPATAGKTTAKTHASAVRVVAPGERVKAAPGVELWLTPEGKHWSTGDGGENFRSVVDGNLDMSAPGVSHQTEGTAKRLFHSGVWYGTKAAARVVLTDAAGKVTTAKLVELPGKPGWGAWYATTPAAAGTGHGVTLYDRHGRVLAELPGFDR
ncbi:hypothetical protein ACIRD2_31665 [Streptomyces sp. NPDC093595]|uniref:hypothetical protein n=1 Tax=Streptomyces sp. NPDC093595 TaxID=3366045 RepID=UPI0037F48073